MPITQQQLSKRIEGILNADSDNENISPAQARKRLANEIAAAVAEFVIGRKTTVTGTSATGGAVTGTGIINT